MATTPILCSCPPHFRTARTSHRMATPILSAWLPVALFTCLFAIESTASFGSDHTSAPLHALCHSVAGNAINTHWSYIHHILRKTGHFAGYGLFSLLCFRAWQLTLRNQTRRLSNRLHLLSNHTLAIATVFVIASADELHQCFLPNRTGRFSDVLLDIIGAATLQAVLYLVPAAITLAAMRNQTQNLTSNNPH